MKAFKVNEITVVRQNRKQVVNSSETFDFTGSCCRFSKAGGGSGGPKQVIVDRKFCVSFPFLVMQCKQALNTDVSCQMDA